MKQFFLALAGAMLLAIGSLKADEGMWLLPLLEKMNIRDMKKAGSQLTAEQIYSLNKSSLKDAVVRFGNGCTGELISSEGLLLTNHHCGYGVIQQHSSVEHDYLQDGFWAADFSQEIVSPGLTVTFLDKIEDVTSRILPELDKTANEADRSKKYNELVELIQKEYPDNEFTRVTILPLYGGNVFYLFQYTIFKDVRFVGAPPSSIGKFGADTDNWMWPRHTGDFSLFRVYATKDGKPSNPSPDNVPYKPKNYFKVSLKGIQEGDFAMVLGYPGRTYRFMTSYEVDELTNTNQVRIFTSGIKQDVWMNAMRADQKTRIQYASKYAGSSNGWKKSIGMNETFTKLGVVERRVQQEKAFTDWVNENAERKMKYGEALSLIEKAVTDRQEAQLIQQKTAACLLGIELVGIASRVADIYKEDPAKVAEATVRKTLQDFYKDYNVALDKKLAQTFLPAYVELVDENKRPDIFSTTIAKNYNNDLDRYVNDLFNTSIFASEAKALEFIKNPNLDLLNNDMAVQMAKSIAKMNEQLLKEKVAPARELHSKGTRLYIAGLMDMNGGKSMYPDANGTMRLTYGNVKGYQPRDAVQYSYYTSLTGVMEKEDVNNWEFIVHSKLKQLYQERNFGQYGMKNGQMPVNFIFNGDITGGNSGSPVLNGKGELIGIAFDGNWEAMSGDVLFEPELQRCINVDIRYTLFVIDKFANAQRLINEMTIVK